MRISMSLARSLAAGGDSNAERIFDILAAYRHQYNVDVYWENDGIGYLLVISPKPPTLEEVEEEFFSSPPRYSDFPEPYTVQELLNI